MPFIATYNKLLAVDINQLISKFNYRSKSRPDYVSYLRIKTRILILCYLHTMDSVENIADTQFLEDFNWENLSSSLMSGVHRVPVD